MIDHSRVNFNFFWKSALSLPVIFASLQSDEFPLIQLISLLLILNWVVFSHLLIGATVELYYKYDYMFCRHKTFWKIAICYALSNGVCDEWLSLIEPIMNDALKVIVYALLC